ncbi:MAG: AAA family ATPase [Actinomycetota bacterium]
MQPAIEDLSRYRAPTTVEKLGIEQSHVEDLFMRRVLTERTTTVTAAAAACLLAPRVGIELAEALREKALIEYLGATGRDYRIQLTEAGQRLTTQRMSTGRHVSGAPVNLLDYWRTVQAQHSPLAIDRSAMTEAFNDLTVGEDLLDKLGPAFVSEGAMFLYGPAGTGKTSIAERLNRLYGTAVLVPHFVEMDGQIVAVFDPALHEPVEQPPNLDPRWVLCQRPLVMVGGEMERSMLDLSFDAATGLSVAPIQMLATNGILLVDDFGRQSISPEDILNRWIVPLSRGIDYLLTPAGTKITVPFELKLVLSTNLDPNSLGDDAFLRRLRNKVFIGPITEQAFHSIVTTTMARHRIELAPNAIERLAAVCHEQVGELRPYVANDYAKLALAVCSYENTPQVLDDWMIDRVTSLYFVHEEANHMPTPQFDFWSSASSVVASHQSGPPTSSPEDEIDSAEFMASLEALAETQTVDGLVDNADLH